MNSPKKSLRYWIEHENIEQIKQVLDQYPELVYYKDSRNLMPIDWAIMDNRCAVVELLFEKYGIDILTPTKLGSLLEAVVYHYYSNGMVKTVLNYCPEKLQGQIYEYALAKAVDNNDLEIAATLLNRGLSPNASGTNDRYLNDHSLLSRAASHANFSNGMSREMMTLLLGNGADINFKEGVALKAAIARKIPSVVRFVLENGANPNLHSKDTDEPLSQCIKFGGSHTDWQIEIFDLLLQYGADLKQRHSEKPRLHLNIHTNYCNIQFAKKLLEIGDDINEQDADGNTALIYVIQEYLKEVEYKRDYDLENHVANNHGEHYQKMFEFLVEHGACFSYKNNLCYNGKQGLSVADYIDRLPEIIRNKWVESFPIIKKAHITVELHALNRVAERPHPEDHVITL